MTSVIQDDTSAVARDWNAEDETRTPIIPDEFSRGAVGLRNIYGELNAFLHESDDECAPPTTRAFNEALDILERTAYAAMSKFNCELPSGYVMTDESGGVRIEWWNNRTHCVHLVVHHDDPAKDYVFVKLGADEGAVNRRVLPGRLASQLKRISELRHSEV
jgi:hypothetical protein